MRGKSPEKAFKKLGQFLFSHQIKKDGRRKGRGKDEVHSHKKEKNKLSIQSKGLREKKKEIHRGGRNPDSKNAGSVVKKNQHLEDVFGDSSGKPGQMNG